MHVPSGFSAFRHRDFRLFFIGQLISLVGSWMQTVGQSWLILQLSDSPLKLGLISTLQFLPTLAFSLFAGAIIDRLPKRKVILATQVALMSCALILSALVITNRVQYWHVAVLALLLGLATCVDMPARQSFIVEMVGKEDLMNAIALNSAMFNGARILGPAAAGFLIAKYGVGPAFLLNGVSFLAVIGALLLIRAEGAPKPRKNKTIMQEIREGVSYVIRSPEPTFVLGMLLFVSLFVINFSVLIPLLAKKMLEVDASGFGFLMSAMGGGALIGALALAMQGRQRPPLKSLVIPAAVLSAATLIVAFLHNFYLVSAVLAAIGYAQIRFTAQGNTLLQVSTPDDLRGRVMSLYTLVFAGTVPLASLSLGLITERFGAAAGWWSSGGLGLLSVIVITGWWNLRTKRLSEPAI